MHMNIPLQEPVLIFGFAVLIFLLFPILMGKLRVPAIIGPIIAGIIIGPNGLGLLARDSTIELLGTVGLLFIMFIAGLELDFDGFKKYRNRSILFGLLSFGDRKSTRLNSSHVAISYAVFCLKKK